MQVLPTYSAAHGDDEEGSIISESSSSSGSSAASRSSSNTLSSSGSTMTVSSASQSNFTIPSHSSSSSSFSSVQTKRAASKLSDLHDQLSTSPDTRFHAAYIFLRYFYLVGDGSQATSNRASICEDQSDDEDSSIDWGSEYPEMEMERKTQKGSLRLLQLDLGLTEGREMVTWDTAVACLALSVKVQFQSSWFLVAKELTVE